MVTRENKASLQDDAFLWAHNATAETLRDALAGLAKKAKRILGTSTNKAFISVSQKVLAAAKKQGLGLAQHAARMALEHAYTSAAAARMAELPLGLEHGAGGVAGHVSVTDDGTQAVRPFADEVVQENEIPPPISLVQEQANADISGLVKLLRAEKAKLESTDTVTIGTESTTLAMAPTALAVAPDPVPGAATSQVSPLVKKLEEQQRKLAATVGKIPVASEISEAIKHDVERESIFHDARIEVDETKGDRVKLMNLKDRTESDAKSARKIETKDLKDTKHTLEAQVEAAKARLKASAWLAKLAPHDTKTGGKPQVNSGSLSTFSAELGHEEDTMDMKDIVRRYRRKERDLKDQYEEEAREHAMEHAHALKKVEIQAEDAKTALKQLRASSKAREVQLEKELAEEKVKAKSQAHSAKANMALTEKQMASVLTANQQMFTTQLEQLKASATEKINNMKAAWHAKKEALKAEYELQLKKKSEGR